MSCKMSKVSVFLFLAVLSATVRLHGDDLPDWYTPLRDAVYSQILSSREIEGLYNVTRERAEKEFYGVSLFVMLSRCEYMMGRSLIFEENKDKARACFERGMAYAQESLDLAPSPEGWQMLSENLSYLCTVRSTAFVMANGLKVGKYAKNALDLDAGNTAAQYLIAARWVYAPAAFRDLKKGIQMMHDIHNNYDSRLQKDDRFNVISSIGYGLWQQKKNEEAKNWFVKALEVYPDNKYVKGLLAGL